MRALTEEETKAVFLKLSDYIGKNLEKLVNRSDGVVTRVLIKGTTVWAGTDATDALGREALGVALRAA